MILALLGWPLFNSFACIIAAFMWLWVFRENSPESKVMNAINFVIVTICIWYAVVNLIFGLGLFGVTEKEILPYLRKMLIITFWAPPIRAICNTLYLKQQTKKLRIFVDKRHGE